MTHLKCIFSLIVLIGYNSLVCAQQSRIDSLLNILKSSKEDSIKITVLNDVADAYTSSEPEKTFSYAEKAYTLAEKLDYRKKMPRSLRLMTYAYLITDTPEKALEASQRALKISTELGDSVSIAESLGTIGSVYANKRNNKKALEFYQRALALHERQQNDDGIVTSLNNIGMAYTWQNRYKKAMDIQQRALQLHEKAQNKKGIAFSTGEIGKLHSMQGDYNKGILFLRAALEMYRKLDNKTGMATAFNSIGVAYYLLDDYNEALRFYKRAVEMYKQTGQRIKTANTLNNIANIYVQKNDYEQAIRLLGESREIYTSLEYKRGLARNSNDLGKLYLKMGEPDKALNAQKESLELFKDLNNQFRIAGAYSNIGDIYYQQEQADKALEFYEESLRFSEKATNNFIIARSLIKIGTVYLMQEKYEEAIDILEKSNKRAQDINAKKLQIDALLNLSEAYEKSGDDEKALDHYILYKAVKDSTFNTEKNKQLVEMQTRYETAEKEREIERLTKEQALHEATIARQKQVRYTIAFALLFVFITLFAIYIRYQSRRRINIQKQQIEYEQKALHLQMNPHFLFNALKSIRSYVSQNDFKPALKFLSRFARLMRLILENSQQSWITVEREVNTLKHYMELEQLRFENHFDFHIELNDEIPEDMLIPAMLIQPFVEAAIVQHLAPKNTGKPAIEVCFYDRSDRLICEIKDNGIAPENAESKEEEDVAALKIVQERISIMNKTSGKNIQLHAESITNEQGTHEGNRVQMDLGAITV